MLCARPANMFRIRAFIHRLLAVGAACIVRIACAASAQDTSNLPYMDPKLSPEERAADLVRRMKSEEKCSQLCEPGQGDSAPRCAGV